MTGPFHPRIVGGDNRSTKRRFTARPLALDRVDDAFPIARATTPGLTLDQWRGFASEAMARADAPAPPAIMLVENDRGYIQGICAYRLQRDVRDGAVLTVEHLSTIDLIDTKAVADALLAALESLAREAGCQMIHLHVPEPSPGHAARGGLYDALRAAGHVVDGLRMTKAIGAPAS